MMQLISLNLSDYLLFIKYWEDSYEYANLLEDYSLKLFFETWSSSPHWRREASGPHIQSGTCSSS